jgi:hypothetical protein
VAEINFILTAMLKFAGINANPVLINTIDHGVPVFPVERGLIMLSRLLKLKVKGFY